MRFWFQDGPDASVLRSPSVGSLAFPVGLENRIRQVTDLEPRHQLRNKQNRMRRRGCGADLCPVTAQVCVTSMPGISEVPHRSMAVSSVAGLAWQVPRRACRLWSVPVAGRAPGRRRTGPGPRLWQAGASVTCPAGARDGRVTMGVPYVKWRLRWRAGSKAAPSCQQRQMMRSQARARIRMACGCRQPRPVAAA
jgi:hypothetical protein